MRFLVLPIALLIAGQAAAQAPAYPAVPLDEIAAAISGADVPYFDRKVAYLQRSDLSPLSPAQFVEATSGCSVSATRQGEMGLADIFLNCPGRAPSAGCMTADQQVTIMSSRDGSLAIELSEIRSDKSGCGLVPPMGGA